MDKVRRFMRDNWRRYLLNVVIAAGIAWSLTWYPMTNHATAHVHVLQTAFDRWVPVIPQFIVPYNWLEPVLAGCLLFFFVFHPRIFTAFGIAFIAIEAISNGVYVVFQTEVPRPTNLIPEPAGMSTRSLRRTGPTTPTTASHPCIAACPLLPPASGG